MIKQLPHSTEAELMILGSILFNPPIWYDVVDKIGEQEFYILKNKQLFHILSVLKKENRPFTEDQILLEAQKNKFALDIVDIVAVQSNFTDKINLEPHIAVLRNKEIRRKLIEKSLLLQSICFDELDHERALDQAEKIVFSMSSYRSSFSKTLKEVIHNTFTYLNDSQKESKVIKTDFPDIDAILRGFEPGQFIVLAARPSMGKTALGLSLALNMVRKNIAVGFFSIEMTDEQMGLRSLSLEADLSMHDLYDGSLFKDMDKFRILFQTAQKLQSYPLSFDDCSKTMAEIRSQARKWVQENNVKCIVIDYLGLIRSVRNHDNRYLEVSEISMSLKSLAKELRIPILVLSQLSRNVESRMDKRPMLSDLRDSGAIEQDADIVMFLYRDHYYNKEAHPYEAEVIVAKNRNGALGVARIDFEPTTMKFS